MVKPDPDHPGQLTVVSKGETRVTWEVPKLDVTVAAPKTLGLNQDATATYTVAGSGKVDAGAVTLTARLPPEPVLIAPSRRRRWTATRLSGRCRRRGAEPNGLCGLPPGPARHPDVDGRRPDRGRRHRPRGLPGQICEAKLLLKLDGPAAGMVGEVFRTGSRSRTAATDRPTIRVQGRLDDGLEVAGKDATLDETIASLGAGQSKTIPLTSPPTRIGGNYDFQIAAAGEGRLGGRPAIDDHLRSRKLSCRCRSMGRPAVTSARRRQPGRWWSGIPARCR